MRAPRLLERPAATRIVLLSALVMAAPALGAPGDRIDRFPVALSTDLADADTSPQLAMDNAGRFIAVWVSSDNDDGSFIRARRFAANGTPLGAEITVASELQNGRLFQMPEVALAGDGSFVVAWWVTDEEGPGRVIQVRRYAANDAPLSDQVGVNDSSSARQGLGIDSAGDGRFVVAWGGDDPDEESSTAFARLFSAAAVPQGPAFRASPASPGLENSALPQVAMSPSGAFVVAWQQTADASRDLVIRARRFIASGAQVGGTVTLATTSATNGLPSQDFQIAMSSTGQFVLAYARYVYGSQYPAGYAATGIYARRFDAAAQPLGSEFRVSAGGLVRDRVGVALDLNLAGDFAFAWIGNQSTSGGEQFLHTRLYRASGTPVTSDQGYGFTGTGTGLGGASVGIDGTGNFTAAYQLTTRGSASPIVYAQRFAGYNDTRPSCARYIPTVIGNDAANTLDGGSGADIIYAGGGNDTVHGWGGADVICGGGGSDVLYGGSGDDQLIGGSGDDLLDGGTGSNDYCNGESQTNADTAVSCELTNGVP